MNERPTRHTFARQLDADWARLRHHPPALAVARSWAGAGRSDPLRGLVAEVDDLETIRLATQRGASGGGEGDQLLLQLLALAPVHPLAGRIVLQRILPGLISASARYRSAHRGADPVELVVATAWIAIQHYDVHRRRRHVAASLISDAVYQTFRQPFRRRSAAEVSVPARMFSGRPANDSPISPEIELAGVLAEARRCGVEDHALDVVRQLVRAGSTQAVAEQWGVTARTVRTHRAEAVAQIREAVSAA